MGETCAADIQQGQWVHFPSCTFPAKRTNPWETYLPVGTFRNELFYATGPWADFYAELSLKARHIPAIGRYFVILRW